MGGELCREPTGVQRGLVGAVLENSFTRLSALLLFDRYMLPLLSLRLHGPKILSLLAEGIFSQTRCL